MKEASFNKAFPVPTAVKTLKEQKILPKSLGVGLPQIRAAHSFVRQLPRDLTDVELYVRLESQAQDETILGSYSAMVARIWMLAAPESVVESMCSVIKDIFGENRQLSHSNASKELCVRWNGPEPVCADRLLDLVRQRCQKDNFLTVGQRDIGKVIKRHLRRKCHRVSVYL